MRMRNHPRPLSAIGALCCLVSLVAVPTAAQPEPAPARDERLQELLYSEILFHSRQEDYVSALSRWQLAADQGLLPALSAESELQLARLKLAFGMDVEAGLDFTRLMTAGLAPAERNLAWYELARAFFRKGHYAAADEALGQLDGPVPAVIAGEPGLLQAQVLMALQRDLEAVRVLEGWQGPRELAPYADYNRGVALLRAGRDGEAIAALEQVTAGPGEDAAALALRDRANLALGYISLRQQAYEQARAALQRVRLDSPYANRALQAMGWIAQQQGQQAQALVPWTELRSRNVADPAVQESLLAVPSLHRELQSYATAAAQYEDAVAVYSRELGDIREAIAALQQGHLPDVLGKATVVKEAPGASGASGAPGSRYFGALLASHRVQQTLQGHQDLQLMLNNVDHGLQGMDRLAEEFGVSADAAQTRPATAPNPGGGKERQPGSVVGGPGPTDRGVDNSTLPPAPEWIIEWEGADPTGDEFRGMPLLPEINLPPQRGDRLPESGSAALPESDFGGLPPGADFIGLPPAPIDIGLPQSEMAWLPETGRFTLPERRDPEYAYPDPDFSASRDRPAKGERQARRIGSPSPEPRRPSQTDAGGEALQALAEELAAAADRMAKLGSERLQAAEDNSDLAARIAAMRARILALRARIAAALADHERYTRALALAELRQRQLALEGYLEQARLELAKTYDQATAR
jgi:tetratricopeptide (TPR) repeat protein